MKKPFKRNESKMNMSVKLLGYDKLFKVVNTRITILSIVITCIFFVIIARLASIQVLQHEDYVAKLDAYSPQEQRFTTPRGEMYDRNGELIVKTQSAHNITYFPNLNTTSDEKFELATKFAKQFNIEAENFTLSDYQDMYLYFYRDLEGNKTNGNHLLSEEELLSISTSSEKDKLIRSKITKEMALDLVSEEDMNAYSVYMLMIQAPSNQLKVIVEDASNQDVAYLVEHKEEFAGFDVDFSSWKRIYPYEDTLRDVLGSVSTSKQGVPSEEQAYYQALGYYISDRVGTSGLEKQYETLLAGTPKTAILNYGDDGIAFFDEVQSGKKGYDLHLTIDINLQQKVDTILEDILKEYGHSKGREAFNQAFVMLLNPNTGEILSMSGGMLNDDKTVTKFASGNYLNSYQVGSVVKGATVYMMLNEGIQSATSYEYDAPMDIAGLKKSSYHNMGNVNAVTALEKSSNVYMWKSVIKLAGGSYVAGQPLNISSQKTQDTLNLMRNYYSSFGLGIKTGLDVPNEGLGNTGYISQAGNLLDYSIGQYDSYTPIQLAQYVCTIANGGKRIEPKLVNYASEVNSDYIIYENKTTVLSTVESDEHLQTVRDGFRACVANNYCGVGMNTLDEDIAAKTGTAQVILIGEYAGKYTNTAQIGFAPYDNPEIAFVCIAPTSAADSSNQEINICSNIIMPKVMEAYYELYPSSK